MARENIRYSSLRNPEPIIETLAKEYGEAYPDLVSINTKQMNALMRYATIYTVLKLSLVGSPAEEEALAMRLKAQIELFELFPKFDHFISAVKMAIKTGDKTVASVKDMERRRHLVK